MQVWSESDENFHHPCLADNLVPFKYHPILDDYCIAFSIEWPMSSVIMMIFIIQYWM